MSELGFPRNALSLGWGEQTERAQKPWSYSSQGETSVINVVGKLHIYMAPPKHESRHPFPAGPWTPASPQINHKANKANKEEKKGELSQRMQQSFVPGKSSASPPDIHCLSIIFPEASYHLGLRWGGIFKQNERGLLGFCKLQRYSQGLAWEMD